VGTLYLVATPIGNLQDITIRALEILRQVGLIAAEDTRQTRILLDHYQIRTRLTSYHEHNKLTRLEQVLEALVQGDVALVSDAGTPALNDPGYELVQAALQAGYPVSPVPGPSAPVAALVASGLPTDAFLYLGYLPRKTSQRKALLERIADLPYTLIFLEAPHRLIPALQDLLLVLGDRPLAVARELTKLHEEVLRAHASAAIAHFIQQPPRGEITLVVAGAKELAVWTEEAVVQALQEKLAGGCSPAQMAGEIAERSGWPRRTIYNWITRIQDTSGGEE